MNPAPESQQSPSPKTHPQKLVYVAGKFSGPTRADVEQNIAAAVQVGLQVAALGACPIIPHANTAHPDFEKVQPYPFWIAATAEQLRRCDALITVDNWQGSSGARNEVVIAKDECLPVFHDLAALKLWLDTGPE